MSDVKFSSLITASYLHGNDYIAIVRSGSSTNPIPNPLTPPNNYIVQAKNFTASYAVSSSYSISSSRAATAGYAPTNVDIYCSAIRAADISASGYVSASTIRATTSMTSPIGNFTNFTASNISASGFVSASNITASTSMKSPIGNFTNFTASNITASGYVSASNITASISMTSPIGNFTNFTASNITASGYVSASNITASTSMTSPIGNFTNFTASNITASGYISASSVRAVNFYGTASYATQSLSSSYATQSLSSSYATTASYALTGLGSDGGPAGGATNYLNMVATPTVVASGTGYAVSYSDPQPFVVVSSATMAAAGIPTGATLALLEITVNSQNGPLEVRGRVSSLTPNLTLAKSGLPGFSAGGAANTRNVTQALMPLSSDRSFEYSIVPDGAVVSGTAAWSIKVIGYYSPGIASAGTQTTVFFENETTLANPLATGVTTFNVGSSGLGLVPASATAIVLQILTQNGPSGGTISLKGRGESTHGWKTLISGSGGGAGTYDTDALQVVIPLSAAKTFQLDKDSTFFAIQVYAHGYLLPGTTAATIQTGTAALPTGAGFANGAVITHGLGFVPPHVRVVLRCKNGTNVHGYPEGTELDVNSGVVNGSGGVQSSSMRDTCNISINETSIRIFNHGTGGISLINFAGDTYVDLVGAEIAKWELKAYWARVDGVIPSALAPIQIGLESFVTITSTRNWTCPLGVTKIKVFVLGAGGGGASIPGGATYYFSGGGGGGGGWTVSILTVSPGTIYAVNVGLPGAAGVTGLPGGNSDFAGLVVANGGQGAPAGTANLGIGGNGGAIGTGPSDSYFRAGTNGTTADGFNVAGPGGPSGRNPEDVYTYPLAANIGVGGRGAKRLQNNEGGTATPPSPSSGGLVVIYY